MVDTENFVRNGLAKGIEGYVLYLTGGSSILTKDIRTILKEAPGQILDDYIKDKVLNIPGVNDLLDLTFPRFTEHSVSNAEEYLEFVNQQDRKYLIHDRRTRNKFIEQLVQRLERIVNMNKNYEYEKAIFDKEWESIKNQWGKELPKIVTDY